MQLKIMIDGKLRMMQETNIPSFESLSDLTPKIKRTIGGKDLDLIMNAPKNERAVTSSVGAPGMGGLPVAKRKLNIKPDENNTSSLIADAQGRTLR